MDTIQLLKEALESSRVQSAKIEKDLADFERQLKARKEAASMLLDAEKAKQESLLESGRRLKAASEPQE